MWCFCKVASAAGGMADRRDRLFFASSASCASSVPARACGAVA